MRISDWSSDVCSSDLSCSALFIKLNDPSWFEELNAVTTVRTPLLCIHSSAFSACLKSSFRKDFPAAFLVNPKGRSEEHTSELKSLMRISYAVFCLKKKK